MFGCAGSHRTGKSTVAKEVAAKMSLPFVEIGTSALMREMGIDVTKDIDLDTRLEVQDRILKKAIEIYRAHPKGFVTDRTPLDMYAYTLAEALKENVTPTQAEKIHNYRIKCATATNAYFAKVVVIQPGIPYVSEEGKPPENKAYQEHISTLIMGFMIDDLVKVPYAYLTRGVVDQDRRVELVIGQFEKTKANCVELLKNATVH